MKPPTAPQTHTPFEIEYSRSGLGKDVSYVAYNGPQAQYAYDAVNAHDALVGLVIHMKEYLEGVAEKPSLDVVNKALAAAEGKV